MFRIGEFSRIARVSGRLLRYYDSIGLLSPQHTDPATGYRYYTAAQLPRLNRILALKELGLSLEQTAKLVDEKISTAELRGMLMLKKAELERSLDEAASRLRHVESRLQQIDEQGTMRDYDVVLKSGEAQPFLCVRAIFRGMEDAVAMVGKTARIASHVPAGVRDALVVVAYSDFEDEDLDLEIGFALQHAIARTPRAALDLGMKMSELSAIDQLATIVRRGPAHQSHLAFGALGVWMEANNFRMAGPGRERFLELPFQAARSDETYMEIQFPVSPA